MKDCMPLQQSNSKAHRCPGISAEHSKQKVQISTSRVRDRRIVQISAAATAAAGGMVE